MDDFFQEHYKHLLFCFVFKETIMNITEVSEAAITVRGTFFPPGKNQSLVSHTVGLCDEFKLYHAQRLDQQFSRANDLCCCLLSL